MLETPNITLEVIALFSAIVALLGYTLKRLVNHFVKLSENNARYIETLVALNQKNTENFVNTVSHQRSLDRDMNQKHIEAINGLKQEVHTQSKLLELISKA